MKTAGIAILVVVTLGPAMGHASWRPDWRYATEDDIARFRSAVASTSVDRVSFGWVDNSGATTRHRAIEIGPEKTTELLRILASAKTPTEQDKGQLNRGVYWVDVFPKSHPRSEEMRIQCVRGDFVKIWTDSETPGTPVEVWFVLPGLAEALRPYVAEMQIAEQDKSSVGGKPPR